MRRQWLCIASALPLLTAMTLVILDSGEGMSFLEMVPGLWDLSGLRWIQVWGAVLLGCLILMAVVARIYWRCPACERFLGRKPFHRSCPHCGARISDSVHGRY